VQVGHRAFPQQLWQARSVLIVAFGAEVGWLMTRTL
jgi:hypothetical protein